MKVRKLAVALALAGGLSSGLAHALGMGEGRILTRLNEPLRAEIELTQPGDVSMDQIKIGLAPEDDFERFGIRRMGMLHQLDFEVTRDADNKLIVEITTDKPVREPFLKMLVELTWPNGRLMREYSFLVDPPERSSGPEAAGPEAAGPEADSGAGQSQARPPEPDERRSTTRGTQTSAESGQPDEYGPTSANDTLWGIAGRVNAPADVSRQQVMLALKDANPGAFVNENINQLRQGQVLRFPSEQQIRARSTQQAVREVMAQNEAYQSRQGGAASDAVVEDSASDSGSQGAGSGAADGAGSGDDELRILVADNESGDGEGDTAGMGDGEGDEDLKAALEELDRAERDREELKSRLGDLEEQINTMAQLIELKDDQLAQLQQRLAEADEDAEIPDDLQASGDSGDADAAAASPEGDEDSDRADAAPAASDAGEDSPDPASDEAPEPEPESEAGDEGESSTADAGDTAEPATDSGAGGEQETAGADTDAATAADDSQEQTTGMPEAPTSVGGFFDRLVREPVYQIGAGVLGIILLLLLWGLARRNAAREKAFYDQIRDVSGDEETQDVLDLESEDAASFADEDLGEDADEAASESAQTGDDAMAEADVYMAYGRMEQAAQHLEEAISQEPSRTDLRLKLLEVYAGSGDSETFEKQYRELSALGDEQAVEQADALRRQMGDAGEDLSIDDLAEQLKTGSSEEAEASGTDAYEDDAFDFSALNEADDLLSEDESSGGTTSTETDQAFEFEEDFGFDDDELQETQQGAGEDESIDFEYTGTGSGTAEAEPEQAASDDDVEDLGFSLDDLELEEPEPEAEASEAPAEQESTEASGLDLDLEDESAIPDANEFADMSDEEIPLAGTDAEEAESEEPLAEEEPEPLTEITESVEEQAQPEESADTDAEPFDDSFLEELDAELDKVTEEEFGEEGGETGSGESVSEPEPEAGTTQASEEAGTAEEDFSDLELDVSEDDLALMDELTGDESGEESGETSGQPAESSEQDEYELLDTDFEDASAEEALSDEEKAALEGEELPVAENAPEAGETAGNESMETASEDQSTSAEDEDDDEFDFLEGTDEAGTKLDLARAYVEMGDAEGARDILEEVSKEGSEEQQQEAQRLLGEL